MKKRSVEEILGSGVFPGPGGEDDFLDLPLDHGPGDCVPRGGYQSGKLCSTSSSSRHHDRSEDLDKFGHKNLLDHDDFYDGGEADDDEDDYFYRRRPGAGSGGKFSTAGTTTTTKRATTGDLSTSSCSTTTSKPKRPALKVLSEEELAHWTRGFNTTGVIFGHHFGVGHEDGGRFDDDFPQEERLPTFGKYRSRNSFGDGERLTYNKYG
ncbi:unnamed protein product, partial [Amoebophrya sp. A25]|eukprot:GSA25T00023914001.1